MLTLPEAIPLSTLILSIVAAVFGLARGKEDRRESERRIPASAITAIYVSETIAREMVEEMRGVHHQLERLNDLIVLLVGQKK